MYPEYFTDHSYLREDNKEYKNNFTSMSKRIVCVKHPPTVKKACFHNKKLNQIALH